MSKIFKGFLSAVRNSFRISKVLKDVVCWHLFLGPQEFLILDGAQDFTILTCSEIKTPKSNPLTKVSGLISDIILFYKSINIPFKNVYETDREIAEII